VAGAEPGEGEFVGDRLRFHLAEGGWQESAGIVVGGLGRADEIDLAQRWWRPFGELGVEVITEGLAADVTAADHGSARRERADRRCGVSQVLSLQAWQAVDLEGECEGAEAERSGHGDAGPPRSPDAEPGPEDQQQRHEHGQQIAPVEIVGAEQPEQERHSHGTASDQRRNTGATALVSISTPEQQQESGERQREVDAKRDRSRLPGAVLIAVFAAEELRPGAFEALFKRLLRDPADVGIRGLPRDERDQQRRRRRDGEDRQAVRRRLPPRISNAPSATTTKPAK
jgi:hypothetical protein